MPIAGRGAARRTLGRRGIRRAYRPLPREAFQEASAPPQQERLQRAFGGPTLEEEKYAIVEEAAALKADCDSQRLARLAFQEHLEHFASAEALADAGVAFAVCRLASPETWIFRACREVVLAAIRQNLELLEFVDPAVWREDREAAIAAVSRRGEWLMHVRKELRDDREIALAAVRNDPLALGWASTKLLGDREIVLAGLCGRKADRPFQLRWVSPELRSDKEVVLAAVRQHGRNLQEASEELRADREVVLAAVSQEVWALQYASAELRADEDFVLLCSRIAPSCTYEERHGCRKQAGATVKDRHSRWSFERAKGSAFALPGETAPVLSIILTAAAPCQTETEGKSKSSLLNSSSSSSSSDELELVAEVSLISGQQFTCPCGKLHRERQSPDIFKFGETLVACMERKPEIETPKRIFVVFQTQDGDWEPVTAWDHHRSLSDFVVG